MGLGQFPAHHRAPPRAEGIRRVQQPLVETVRRLEQDHGALLRGQDRQPGAPLPRFPRQEPLEAEPVAGQPGDRERGQDRRGPGNGGDRQVMVDARPHEAVSRVADRGHPGIGDQHHPLPGSNHVHQLRGPGSLVALEVGHHPRLRHHTKATQQGHEAASVLSRDHISSHQGLAQRRTGMGMRSDRGGSQHQYASGRIHNRQPSVAPQSRCCSPTPDAASRLVDLAHGTPRRRFTQLPATPPRDRLPLTSLRHTTPASGP